MREMSFSLTNRCTQTLYENNETTKGAWPGSWHSALSPLYLDYIFMYFYSLGSPTGDSQNGASGVNFAEHDFLSDRGCSQPIFHGWSKQESSERGSGDRCSVEDSKIHRKTKENPHRQWSVFIMWTSPQLRFRAVQHIHSVIKQTATRHFLRVIILLSSFPTSRNYLKLWVNWIHNGSNSL